MSVFGGPCIDCGHPSTYHGVTFCMCEVGANTKQQCDCEGYNNPAFPKVKS